MSTFCGRLADCHLLSIDRFDNENLKSRIFFLSHFHGDHMVGLTSSEFAKRLEAGCRLYTHNITKSLILSDNRFSHWEAEWVIGRDTRPFFVRIPSEPEEDIFVETVPSTFGTQFERQQENSDYIKVSFMPSRHCLGSVMMLFEFSIREQPRRTVLYTGDFRLTANDLRAGSCHPLRVAPYSVKVKDIDALYFDSTFCDKQTEMADREDSKKEVIRLSKEWLNKDPKNKILLWSYANFGHEFLLIALHQELKLKCHITEDKMAVYTAICPREELSRLTDAVTCDATSRLHACSYYKDMEEDCTTEPAPKKRKGDAPMTCPSCNPRDPHVRIIKVSMMAFAMTNSSEISRQFSTRDGIPYWNVQYSCHSSLQEVTEMFKFLRPYAAYPNVIAAGKTEATYMKHFSAYLRKRRPDFNQKDQPSAWAEEIAARAALIEKLRQMQIEEQ